MFGRKEHLNQLEEDSYDLNRVYYRTMKEHGIFDIPPAPPVVTKVNYFFTEVETLESKERNAKWRGKVKAYEEVYDGYRSGI